MEILKLALNPRARVGNTLNMKVLKPIRSLTPGDLVFVSWFDASIGKSLSEAWLARASCALNRFRQVELGGFHGYSWSCR